MATTAKVRRDSPPRTVKSVSWVSALPALWIMSMTIGVLFGVRLGALAALSALWGLVLLHYRMRYMALAAVATGVVTIALLYVITGRLF
ncbi:hypothetical protein [Microbacterium aurum]|uniref:hypothetical protein n=1 Tax=Microbacterium aurum TaxID=36805 RepID=UPI0012F4B70E|nr:hypothetical protein [Microbacterium aurum]MBM7826912.1 hypothetical protein [Microbacterium aurum]